MNKEKTKDEKIAELLISRVPYSQIIDQLRTGNSRISRVAAQLKKNNFDTNCKIESAKIGRPTKITTEVIQMIETETLENPRMGGIALSNKIAQLLCISLSYTTINMIRNQLHFSFKTPRRRSFLTPVHIQNRITFCNGQLKGQIDWSNNVIFSDESRFCIHDDSRRVWIKRGIYNEGTFVNEQKYNKGIMVWGAIGKGWRSPLVLVKGKLNAQGYIDLLSENEIFYSLDKFYGSQNYYFEQDGAPSHRAKKTLTWLNDQNVQVIDNWPANSPDLTCIEQVWAILENRIQKYSINSLKSLYEALQIEWYSIPTEKLNGLINQTPDRFKLCISENGKPIGHKLYTLNRKDEINLKDLFSNSQNQSDDVVDNMSPILKIPLNSKRDMDFCKLIADILYKSEKTPYMLKIDIEQNLIEDYKRVIKHHISIQEVNSNLSSGKYATPSQFKNDIDIMWNNLEIFFGKDSEVVICANVIKNDIELAWLSSSEDEK